MIHDWNIITEPNHIRCTCSCGWKRWVFNTIEAELQVWGHLRGLRLRP